LANVAKPYYRAIGVTLNNNFFEIITTQAAPTKKEETFLFSLLWLASRVPSYYLAMPLTLSLTGTSVQAQS